MTPEKEIDVEPILTVVANIVAKRPFGPAGKATKEGTKTFRPGAKVYIIDWYPGMCQSIIVVGTPRKSKRYIAITISVEWVENLRVKLVYKPAVIRKINKFHSDQPNYLTEAFVNTMYKTIPHWQATLSPRNNNE